MISPKAHVTHVTIDLDNYLVEVVKNGKRYSLIEFIEERINDVLDLRMRDDEGTDRDAEIVRCKDCIHFHENVFGGEIGIGAPYDNLIVGHCGCSRLAGDKDMIYMEPDGFCSLGEREEDGET